MTHLNMFKPLSICRFVIYFVWLNGSHVQREERQRAAPTRHREDKIAIIYMCIYKHPGSVQIGRTDEQIPKRPSDPVQFVFGFLFFYKYGYFLRKKNNVSPQNKMFCRIQIIFHDKKKNLSAEL